MRNVFSLGLVLALTLLVGGCSSFTSGSPIVKHDKGNMPILSSATEDGTYAVYGTFDSSPIFTAEVKKGDPLGFKMSTTGKLTAVAGKMEQSINDGSYVWKKK